MQKNRQHFYRCGAHILTGFCVGFSAFATPLSGNLHEGAGKVNARSFADDTSNLHNDFTKSFIAVLDNVAEKDTQQLSLDLSHQEHI